MCSGACAFKRVAKHSDKRIHSSKGNTSGNVPSPTGFQRRAAHYGCHPTVKEMGQKPSYDDGGGTEATPMVKEEGGHHTSLPTRWTTIGLVCQREGHTQTHTVSLHLESLALCLLASAD